MNDDDPAAAPGRPAPTSLTVLIARGLRRRCPRCGIGPLFRRWYSLHERCPVCQLAVEPRQGDTWAFMYVTTAAITGLFIAVMLLLDVGDLAAAQTVLLPSAILTIVGTLPMRKGVAIALAYYMDVRSGAPEG